MKNITPPFNGETLVLRAPAPADGKILHHLATDAGTLDVNSPYAYLLHGLHHSACSVVAEIEGCPAGFVSGYWIPGQEAAHGSHLFVWQVGVHPDFRGKGLALEMLISLLQRRENRHVSTIETTISPSNTASIRLFASLARRLGTEMVAVATLGAEFFSLPHEEETIYHIGPYNIVNLKREIK